MQFKHPLLLYALLFLLIPLLVHLFQLRRFQKTPFTNVHFLKEVVLQTRKSSQLKKWLTLICRLLALGLLILAFAQPFLPSKTTGTETGETVLYVDNSFSLQAKGRQGELLQNVKQQLYENPQLPENLSWFSNTTFEKGVGHENFRRDILQLPYAAVQYSPQEVLLQAQNLFSAEAGDKQLLIVSDFQHWDDLPEIPEDIRVKTVQLEPVNTHNISIDSAYRTTVSPAVSRLSVRLSYQGEQPDNVPVSLYNGEELVAKASAVFEEGATVDFEIADNGPFRGRIAVTDSQLLFDNQLYVAINPLEKIQVLSIDAADNRFLQRIFTSDEFRFTVQAHDQPDYSPIPNQHLIILNELPQIPETLQAALTSFAQNGGTVLVIPAENADADSYDNLLGQLQFGRLGKASKVEKQITTIHFSHPVYNQVFENPVQNFQYPKTQYSYALVGSGTPLLSFQDNRPFLSQNHTTYVFAAPLQAGQSNFTGSPLVVPTLYNIAKMSLKTPVLYYTLGRDNTFDVPIRLQQDQVLKLEKEGDSFIPRQQAFAGKVSVTTHETPDQDGVYELTYDQEVLQSIAYNYPRTESRLRYTDISQWPGAEQYNSINGLFEAAAAERTERDFWKLCLIFALLFLVAEMLILKLMP